ncbi:uncharacterized protein A4U43_C08F14860 [Asparagus officinalis]|nr:uncharacterized protein A4U43_C08F14860 [Asparagus officinalis]
MVMSDYKASTPTSTLPRVRHPRPPRQAPRPLPLRGVSQPPLRHRLQLLRRDQGPLSFGPQVALHGRAGLHAKLVGEIRSTVRDADEGKITFTALSKMELTSSVVYEVLRLEPPVKFQYGKAKKDLIIESHDAAYKVKKGEMLFGYQPFATRDKKVFERGEERVCG